LTFNRNIFSIDRHGIFQKQLLSPRFSYSRCRHVREIQFSSPFWKYKVERVRILNSVIFMIGYLIFMLWFIIMPTTIYDHILDSICQLVACLSISCWVTGTILYLLKKNDELIYPIQKYLTEPYQSMATLNGTRPFKPMITQEFGLITSLF